MVTVFFIVVAVQLVFGLLYFRLPKSLFGKAFEEDLPCVSILICGKNEAHHFPQFLPLVLQQDYPSELFEVVVVNDVSTDGSDLILEKMQHQYPQLRVVSIALEEQKTFPGKKHALIKGLEFCKNDVVLLTDADCKPASNQWLRIMATAYIAQQKKSKTEEIFVLGYGAYETKTSILNRFIRWETVHTFMQYASWAKLGLPYMGVGRNMLYNKKPVLHLIENDFAFQKIFKNTPSGDDDLIVSKLATAANTIIIAHPEAKTISTAKDTFAEWWKQKTRHVSTGKLYPDFVKMGLGLYGLSYVLFWVLGTVWLAYYCGSPWFYTILFLFLLRLILYWINAARWYFLLEEKKLSLFYPFGDCAWMIYNVFLSPFIFWKNKQQWK